MLAACVALPKPATARWRPILMLAAHMPQPNKASQHTIVADAYDSRCTRVLDNPSGAHKLRLMLMMLLMLAAHVPNKTKLSGTLYSC